MFVLMSFDEILIRVFGELLILLLNLYLVKYLI